MFPGAFSKERTFALFVHTEVVVAPDRKFVRTHCTSFRDCNRMEESPATIEARDATASATTSLFKVKGLRWWVMGLIMLGSILNYLTRSTLSVAAPTVLQDLRIDEHQYSYVVAAFQI